MNPIGPKHPEDPVFADIADADRALAMASRAAEIDRTPAFPRTEFRELGRRRLLGLRTSAARGGRGLSMSVAGAALADLAYRGGTMFAKLSLQPDFCGVLADHATPDLLEGYFLPLTRGETLIGNQITEPGAGADPAALTMSARRDGPGYVLTGTKSQAAFASDADAAIVYARTGDTGDRAAGITAFLVPQNQLGIDRTVGNDLGERWMRRGTVTYREVRVPREHLLGEEGQGFEYLKEELSRERLLLAAIYVGVGRSSLEDTVQRAATRTTFGRPLHQHEAVAFPTVEDWALLEATWLYVARALERADAGESLDAESAMAKWMATDVALRTIDHAIQFHGGEGYGNALPHERRWRDVRSGRLAHGPSEIMHLVAARALWRDAPRSR
ncbi:MAG: acyl-CoA dehydrogenase [Thermoplasmata archaeon]|nr:acyl-CoA dehydrogenase [Thermoplasmata archaeon]